MAGVLGFSLVTILGAPSTARGAVADVFAAELTAEAEVPTPGPEGATGTASLASYLDRVEICYEISVEGLAPGDVVTASQIHIGEEGVSGDAVLTLFTELPAGDPIYGCVQDFGSDLQNDLLSNPGGYYVNIDTEAYPDGALRGQIELVAAGIPPGTCNIVVTPGTVAVGQQFVVSGDFGGYVEIHLVPGEDAPLPEDGEPVATVPEGVWPFSVTITAKAHDVGSWTVWAFRPEARGCADSAALRIVVGSDTAAKTRGPRLPVAAILVLVMGLAVAAAAAFRDRRMEAAPPTARGER